MIAYESAAQARLAAHMRDVGVEVEAEFEAAQNDCDDAISAEWPAEWRNSLDVALFETAWHAQFAGAQRKRA